MKRKRMNILLLFVLLALTMSGCLRIEPSKLDTSQPEGLWLLMLELQAIETQRQQEANQ